MEDFPLNCPILLLNGAYSGLNGGNTRGIPGYSGGWTESRRRADRHGANSKDGEIWLDTSYKFSVDSCQRSRFFGSGVAGQSFGNCKNLLEVRSEKIFGHLHPGWGGGYRGLLGPFRRPSHHKTD